MPVRSLHSFVLKWPDWQQVDTATRQWAREQRKLHPELLRVGYFGSYARGDWGVGSDLDLIAIVEDDLRPFEQRGRDWNLLSFPVPAEILVYTKGEWEQMHKRGGRFADTLRKETVWIL